MRPSACRCASLKLCMPTDKRVTPAARKARKRSRSKVPGLASSVISPSASSLQARADIGQQPVDRRGREQAGRAAADKDRMDRAAPDQRQRGLEVGHQRVEVGFFGQVASPPRLVRIEVAVRALAQAPRHMDVERQRRQRGQLQRPGPHGSTRRPARRRGRRRVIGSAASARASAPAWRAPPARGGCARSSAPAAAAAAVLPSAGRNMRVVAEAVVAARLARDLAGRAALGNQRLGIGGGAQRTSMQYSAARRSATPASCSSSARFTLSGVALLVANCVA